MTAEAAPQLVSFDTETLKIIPGCPAPPIVVGSWCGLGGVPRAAEAASLRSVLASLLDSGSTLAMANGAFDFAAAAARWPELRRAIFEAYNKGRVHDVLLAEGLNAIYHGTFGIDPRTGGSLRKPSTGEETDRYSLEVVTNLVLGRVDAKDSADYRMSYALLHGFPMHRWPQDARQYLVDDARNPLDIALVQLGGHKNLGDLAVQTEAAFALQLGSCWSLRTDPEKIARLSAEVDEKHRIAVERFQSKGWIRENGSEDQAAIKRSVAIAYGVHGTCRRCGGEGKIRPRKSKPCRGQKVRGRYPGCPGHECLVCHGSGEVYFSGDPVTCKAADGEYRCPVCGDLQYAHPQGGVTCPRGHAGTEPTLVTGCDGTGLDLGTVPKLPRADKGGISASRDTLLESGDDELAAFGANEYDKIRTTQLPWLRTGTTRPLGYGVNALVSTTRISYEGSPAHQMTREGGERECIRARGAWCGSPVEYVLGSSDYGAGELCALSQFTYWKFGYSEMLRFINETGDPGVLHSVLGAEVLGITLDEFLKRRKEKAIALVRQSMKPISFGKPAAMGSAKIAITARGKANGFTVCENGPAFNKKGEPGYWGIRFCITIGGAKACGVEKIYEWKKNECKPVCKACVEVVEYLLTPAYFKRFPEITDYHKWGKAAVKRGDRTVIALYDQEEGRPRVVVERGGCNLSAFLNTPFQGMIAAITKRAYIAATRECYLGEKPDGSESPLYGSRLPLFVHDELVSELILDKSDKAGRRITEVMESTGSRYAPDCKAWKADTALAYWFSKGMEPVEKNGILVPWDQDKMDAWKAS